MLRSCNSWSALCCTLQEHTSWACSVAWPSSCRTRFVACGGGLCLRAHCLTICPSRSRFAARLNSGVIRGQAIGISVLPQGHRLGFAGPRRNKQTARFGQHHVSAASLSFAFGPIAYSPRRDRCTSKSSPRCGLAPSRRRIGLGAANMAAHCRSSGAAFHGSRLSFATLLPRLRFAAGAV